MLDQDDVTNTNHAQFRQYSSNQGHWLSPDPDSGSYDFTNPESLNRYAYLMNDPDSSVDPTGTDGTSLGPTAVGAIGGCTGAVVTEGANILGDIGCALEAGKFIFGLFGGPTFHGSLEPRPGSGGLWNDSFHVPRVSVAAALGLPDAGCEFGACGSSLTDNNQTQTASQLQQAYNEVISSRIGGLLNIKNHSCGGCKYDYGWNSQSADTWNVCGRTFNADQFGNFMAGYQAGAYDKYYFWTTGAIWAQGSVDAAGVLYHLTGRTKATSDPLDRTGMPDILRGQRYARDGCSAM